MSKRLTAIILTMLCLFNAIFTSAQQITNGGFETDATGWELNPATPIAPGYIAAGFTAQTDTKISHSGNHSVHISKDSGNGQASFGVFRQVIKGNFQGKKLTFSGFIKTNDVKNGGATMWYEIYNLTASNLKDMSPEYVTGTTGWKKYIMEIIITQPTDYIVIGGLLMGEGNAWFDDFSISSTPLINEIEMNSFKGNIQRAIIPVQQNLSLQDLQKIFPQKKSNKIIGLGEVTHGTAEAYTLRSEMSQFLVENRGFTTICLENSYGWTENINDYIQTGKGDLGALMKKNLLGMWQNEEMKAFFVWMRSYNKSHKQKIKIKGMDYSQLSSSAELIKNNMAAIKSDSIQLLNLKLVAYCSFIDSCYHGYNVPGFQADEKKMAENMIEIYEISEIIQNSLKHNRKLYLKNISIDKMLQTETALINLSLAGNNFYRVIKLQQKGISRDSIMFEMIKRFTKETPDARIIVWAHNAHIAKKPIYDDSNGGGMGEYLNAYYPGQYTSIGMGTATGTYAATNENFVTEKSKFSSVDFDEPSNGSVEALLGSENDPSLFVDLKKVKPGLPELYHRVIGQLNVKGKEPYVKVQLKKLYDGFIFIRKTSAAHSF